MKRISLVLLLLAAVAGVALLGGVLAQTTATGTVTVTVSGYIAAAPVDTASVLVVDPAKAQTVSYNGIPSWINVNATDDMIFNMTGTNVNLTVAYYYSIVVPSSYPSGLQKPIVAVFLNLTTGSTQTNITGAAQIPMQNYTISIDLTNDNLYNQYAATLKQLTWIDLPEGFLNTFYGLSYNETQWYNYTYAAKVTIPSVITLYNATSGKFTMAGQTSLCILVVDPDNSLAAGQLSGDEMVLVNPTCDFDVDASNATAAATAPSRADLAPTADYVVPQGTAALAGKPAVTFYNYNQTDYMVLNFTVSYPTGATERTYYRVVLSLNSGTLEVTLVPVLPVPYSADLAPIYAGGKQPYLHAWPAIVLPVGAPAGKYKATVYLELEQT